MTETTTTTLPLFVKDPVPVPLPGPRSKGLTGYLRELAVGESATVPRKAADDIYKLGAVLGMSFTARRLDARRSRVWRVK
jgi:hypothetical protein